MESRSGSRKKSGSTSSGDKDLIAGLKDRIAALENELRLKRDQTALDDAERRQADKRLEEQEKFLRNVFECIQDGVSVLDKDLNILRVNPAMEKWYGQVAGKKCYRAYHGRSKPCEPCPSIRAIKMGTTQSGIVRDLKGWREIYAFPMVNDRGEVTGVIEHVRDIDERMRAEEALRESEAKYRFLVENSKDLVWKMDLEGRWTFVGGNVEGVTGYGHDEVMGKTIWDFIVPESHASIKEKLRARMRGEDILPYVTWIINKAGDRVPLEVATTAIVDEGGRIVGVQGISRDITLRMRAEEALRESEAKFRQMAENINSMFWISSLSKDTGLKYLYMSPAFERIMGIPVETLYADPQSWIKLIHPDDRERFMAAMRKRMRGDCADVEVPEYRIIKPDGTVRWIKARVYPVKVNDEVDRFAGIAEDITERKRAEDAAKLANAYNRSLIEASLDPLVTISLDGKITDVNMATEMVTGISRDKLIGTDFSDYFTDPDMARKGYRKAFEEGSVKDYPLELRHRYGRITPVLYNATVYRDEAGRVIGVFAAARDITERKRAEEALMEAKAQAELYVDLMGHDINNMNQVSMGFLELAHNIIDMEGELGEDNVVLLDKAMSSLTSSSQLIDNVRKLQREKMGLYKPEVLDIDGVIEEAAKQFHSIPGRDVRIVRSVPKGCRVLANGLLKDVFTNLIGNAVKHSRGAITVSINASNVMDKGVKYCRVDVEDDGPGIPDELKKTLFDRLSLTTTRARGKGFGLCLIKILVDDYHGSFWVEDRVKGDHTKGARFVVMLPAVDE